MKKQQICRIILLIWKNLKYNDFVNFMAFVREGDWSQ